VWFCYFFQLNFNKLYTISVTKIVEITYTIYQGFSKRQLCKEYVRRKVNNASGVNLCWNFAFVHTPSSPREITWPEPVIQLKKNSNWSAVNFKNTQLWWARDIVMWYWSVDSLWQLSINHNTDAPNQRYSYGNGATLLVFKVFANGRTDIQTYGRTITWQPKSFRSMDYQIFW